MSRLDVVGPRDAIIQRFRIRLTSPPWMQCAVRCRVFKQSTEKPWFRASPRVTPRSNVPPPLRPIQLWMTHDSNVGRSVHHLHCLRHRTPYRQPLSDFAVCTGRRPAAANNCRELPHALQDWSSVYRFFCQLTDALIVDGNIERRISS